MRIVHVISGVNPENGGPTFALQGLTEAQVRAGLDVAVLSTWQTASGFPVAEHMREHGVNVQLIGKATGKLSRHPELARTVDQAVAGADVVHIHGLWEEIQHQAARSAQRRGVSYVVTPHGMLSPWSLGQGRWFNRLGKRLYLAMRLRRNLDRATALHFTASAERELVAPLRLNAPSIIEPVGIDVEEFCELPPRGAFRAAHPRIGERPMVLFLSRLSPQKGLDRLIPAFGQMVAAGASDAVLVLAGPDYEQYSQIAHSLVKQNRLEDRVIFTGMLHGRARIEALVDADLMALPSHHENFGIVVAEAMAAAAPVVVSRQVNIFQEVAEAGAGAVVSGEPSELAAEMRRWLDDPARRHAAGQRGREFAMTRYDWNSIARNWVGHYARLMERAR